MRDQSQLDAEGLELVEDRAAGLVHETARPAATKASRPRSKRVWPSLASSFSTTFCVAMPAWSVPGTQSTLPAAHPLEADQHVLHRVVEPVAHVQHCAVTLGGGIMITYGAVRGGRRRRREEAARPPAVEVGFDGGGIVLRGQGGSVMRTGRSV